MSNLQQAIRKSLIAGSLALLPALIFFLILKWIIRFFGGFVQPISMLFGPETRSQRWFWYAIVGISLLLMCLLIGAVIRTRWGSVWHRYVDTGLKRHVYGYSLIRDIVSQLFGEKKFLFSDVAIVRLFNSDTLATSFITDRHSDGSFTVFVPTGPNPTTGFIYHLPASEVYPIDIPIDETMKSIISCGVGSKSLIDEYIHRNRNSKMIKELVLERGDIPGIGSVAPTLCQLMRLDPPADCAVESLPLSYPRPITRVLLFLPDAVGVHLLGHRHGLAERFLTQAPLSCFLHAAMPSVTPVCFATMLTGSEPEHHGIRRYEKPVLACDTLFDVWVRAGMRVALIAVRDSSMDTIFRGRAIDYFPEDDDAAVAEKARKVITEDQHEVVVVYQQGYDDALHAGSVFAEKALEAAEYYAETFESLTSLANHEWSAHDRVYVVAPDHGAHNDPGSGFGTHGENIPDDMEVRHFWGIHPRKGIE